MEILQQVPVPECFPFPPNDEIYSSVDHFAQFKARDYWLEQGMFAFVSYDWVRPFADWIGDRKVLEVMSGAGWLAEALRECGTDVIATDNFKWTDARKWPLRTHVEKLSAFQAVLKYGSSVDLMIVSWPYMDDHAYYALRAFDKVNPGAPTVYIGESDGGCTASERFFSHYDEIWLADFQNAVSKYRSWFGLHDTLKIGRFIKW